MKGLIFTYVVTYGGAAAGLFNPFYGLLAYVCFAVVKPEQLWFWSVEPGNYSRIIAIAMLIGWALQGFGNWQFGKAKWVVAIFSGYMFACVTSAFFAPNQKVAWDFVELTAKIYLPFLVGVTMVRTERELRILSWVIVGSIGYVGYNENIKYIEWGIANWDNMTAHAMAVGAALAFFLGTATEKPWAKWLAFAMAGLMAHAVMFHMSRGAMVGLAVAAMLSFWVMPKTPRGLGILALGLICGLYLAGDDVMREFETIFASQEERDASAQSRFDLWADMWTETKRNPVVGIGPRHWPLIAASYGWPDGKEGHGLWFQSLAEVGVPGGVAFLSFYLSCAFLVWPLARGKRSAEYLHLAPFARMSLVASMTFVAEAMFGSFSTMELPYYATMLGVVTLRLASSPAVAVHPAMAAPQPTGLQPWMRHSMISARK